ncbi:MAG: hypothetical protein Q9187_004162, partial [Circinaria calcarea]
MFLNMFSCSPIAAAYTLQSIGSLADPRTIKCLDRGGISLATRTVHIVTDWLLLPVPLIIIFRLQLPLKKKLRLAFVFCIGLVSSIASVVRNFLVTEVTTDLPYDYYDIYAWNIVDIAFATIVASLPALNSLEDTLIRRVKQWSIGLNLSGSSSFLSKFLTLSSRAIKRNPPSEDIAESSMNGKYSNKSSDSFDPIIHRQIDVELETSSAHTGGEEANGGIFIGAADK